LSLSFGPEHGADARGLGQGGLPQALEAPGFAEVLERFRDRLFG
jgi:hypothetical protein